MSRSTLVKMKPSEMLRSAAKLIEAVGWTPRKRLPKNLIEEDRYTLGSKKDGLTLCGALCEVSGMRPTYSASLRDDVGNDRVHFVARATYLAPALDRLGLSGLRDWCFMENDPKYTQENVTLALNTAADSAELGGQ